MARTETITKTVYTFDELSDDAKVKAREGYRGDDGGLDYDWWDSVYDDATEIGRLMGISIDKIYFSGFGSQGDGACFTGTYSYAKGCAKAVKGYAPVDEELHRIARELQDVQRRNFYRVTASISHRDRYYHEYSSSIEIDQCSIEDQGTVAGLLGDLMRWIYLKLDETIRINEYEFTEDGARA